MTADELKELINLLSGIQTGDPARDAKLKGALITNAKNRNALPLPTLRRRGPEQWLSP